MNANDVARQKYLQLMGQVEELEDRVADIEKRPRTPVLADELRALQVKLGEQRTELARLSAGCGVPHAR